MPVSTIEEEEGEFAPFDPTDLGTHHSGLPVEPDGSGTTDPHPVTDGNPGVGASEEADLPEFDPRHREALEGLLFLGAMTRNFSWGNHDFVIRTLTTDELLAVALLQKPYVGSAGEMKAYASLMVAASIVSVDGKVLPVVPVETGENAALTLIREKFAYVSKKWFPPTIDKVFQEYLILESKVNQVIEAMLNSSAGNAEG